MSTATSLRAPLVLTFLAACVAGANGCTGEVDFGPARPDGGPRPDSGVPLPACEGLCVGTSHLQRITRAEYESAVVDVFGVWPDVASLPSDSAIGGAFFSNEPDEAVVGPNHVDSYQTAAESIARAILAAQAELLAAVPSCTTRNAACLRAFAGVYGPQLYRRPLVPDEVQAFGRLIDWSLATPTDPEMVTGAGAGFDDALQYLLEYLLQSPAFLYRPEHGEPTDDPGIARLTSREMASRLAFFLLRSVPDDALNEAAARDELQDSAQIEAQARRLLSLVDSAGRDRDPLWWSFAAGWLSTHRIGDSPIQSLDTEGRWTDRVPRELMFDVHHTLAHIARHDGHLRTLLTSPGGEHQGGSIDWIVGTSGPRWTWADEMPGRRGIMTLPGVLIANGHWGFTHAHQRGLFVRSRLLCQAIGSPPEALAAAVANALQDETDAPSAVTDRQRLANTTERSPACVGCHRLTNPIGYALDYWDAFGRRREVELGSDGVTYPLDTSGELSGRSDGTLSTDVDGAFEDGEELIDRLAESRTVAACMTRQLVRFALAREPTQDDELSLEAAFERFEATDGDLRELAVAITTTDAFRYRRTAPRER